MLNAYPEPARDRRYEFAEKHNIESACWPDLISWTYGGYDFSDCFYGQLCRPGFADFAYCGKCQHYFEGEKTCAA